MKKTVIVLLAVFCMASVAQAELMDYVLQVNSTQTGGATYIDSTHASVTGIGNVVQASLYAYFPSYNPNLGTTGISVGAVSLKSDNGHILGDLSNALTSVFTTTGLQNQGTVKDLDADTDMDVGSTSMASKAYNSDWIYFTSGLSDATADSRGYVKISDVNFTVKSLGDSLATAIQVYPFATTSTLAANNVHTFDLNGTAEAFGKGVSGATFSPSVLTPNILTSGITVSVLVPEPSTLILLGMGLLSLLAIRRRK
jgi:hypothetical protein